MVGFIMWYGWVGSCGFLSFYLYLLSLYQPLAACLSPRQSGMYSDTVITSGWIMWMGRGGRRGRVYLWDVVSRNAGIH